MHQIINSGEDWNIDVVSCENLGRLENVVVPHLKIFYDVLFHEIKVYVRSPGISIHDGKEERLWVDDVSGKDGFQMFSTPGNIGSLSF